MASLLVCMAGCGDGSIQSSGGRELTGSIRMDGSTSTVFPLTETVAEEFMRTHPGVRITGQ